MNAPIISAILSRPNPKGAARLTLIGLASLADGDGFVGNARIEDIARRAALSERSVQYAMRRLEAAGLLIVHRTGGCELNAYQLHVIAPPTT